MDEIGLFPLGIVLLPGERIALHIFELRYRELIGRCLLTGAEFGLVPAGEEGIRPVGTRAAVVEVPRRYPDGRLDIAVEGRQRFRIVERTHGRTFMTARVEPFVDEQEKGRPEQLERCLRALRELLSEGGEDPPGLGEEPSAFAIAVAVELGAETRLALLVSRSEGERLDLLSAELERAAALARWRRKIGERAARNGQVESEDPASNLTPSKGDRTMGTIGLRAEGPVAVVTIDRPEVRNAVDPVTSDALVEAFEAFDADRSLAVAVLTGAGGTFCAGFDLKALAGGERFRVGIDGRSPMGPAGMRLGKPVLAAIEGYAVGGGFELALWCDLRLAARDATFGVLNRRFGVPLVDGGTVRLPRLIGHGRAMDLILTGRPVGAEEAFGMGLVNRLAEPGHALEAAVELANDLAALPQAALRGDRRSAIEQWGLGEAEALANELRQGLETLASGEAVAGAEGFASGQGRHGAPAGPTREPGTPPG